MIVTCPKESDHKDAICLSVQKAVDEKLGDGGLSIEGLLNIAGKMTINNIARSFVDSNVTVQNYFLLSMGRYTFNEHNDVISVGVFNHVFTITKDDILEELAKYGI